MAHSIRSVTPMNITNPFPSPHGPRPGNCWCKRLGIKSSCAQKAELDSVAGGHRQGETDCAMVEDDRLLALGYMPFLDMRWGCLAVLWRACMRSKVCWLKRTNTNLAIPRKHHQNSSRSPHELFKIRWWFYLKKRRHVLASGKRCIYTKDCGFSLKYTPWRQEKNSDKNLFPQWTP